MYIELVNHYRTTREYGDNIEPRPPANENEIADAEKQTGVQFPQELRDMLLELNGDCNLLLSTEEIIEYNKYDMSKNHAKGDLLFIGSDGSGGLYAYIVKNGKVENTNIVFWDHEVDEVYDDDDGGAVSLYELIKKFYDTCYGKFLETAPPQN